MSFQSMLRGCSGHNDYIENQGGNRLTQVAWKMAVKAVYVWVCVSTFFSPGLFFSGSLAILFLCDLACNIVCNACLATLSSLVSMYPSQFRFFLFCVGS